MAVVDVVVDSAPAPDPSPALVLQEEQGIKQQTVFRNLLNFFFFNNQEIIWHRVDVPRALVDVREERVARAIDRFVSAQNLRSVNEVCRKERTFFFF